MREGGNSYSARCKETSSKSLETVETDSVMQGFPVGVWRRSEGQRNVVVELSASDATRCSPIEVEIRRVVAVELHIFRNYEARTSSSATPNVDGSRWKS